MCTFTNCVEQAGRLVEYAAFHGKKIPFGALSVIILVSLEEYFYFS